jgi:hypothetical protein
MTFRTSGPVTTILNLGTNRRKIGKLDLIGNLEIENSTLPEQSTKEATTGSSESFHLWGARRCIRRWRGFVRRFGIRALLLFQRKADCGK